MVIAEVSLTVAVLLVWLQAFGLSRDIEKLQKKVNNTSVVEKLASIQNEMAALKIEHQDTRKRVMTLQSTAGGLTKKIIKLSRVLQDIYPTNEIAKMELPDTD